HERFIATMLAGLGPAPAVLFVVAADEGWRRQSAEHLGAIDALGLAHGLLAVTRSDRADPGAALAAARAEIAGSSLGDLPAVGVSTVTGAGLSELRAALARLGAALPAPRTDGRVRLWVDRSFSVRGAGTVVTGTLGAGTLRTGDELVLGDRRVTVRGLQSLEAEQPRVAAVARVAVNLRGVDADAVGRGDALCTPNAWRRTALLDVSCSVDPTTLPTELVAHLGTAALPVRVRPLAPPGASRTARLTLHHPWPVEVGDRIVLRDPGRHAVAAGVRVLDVDPPELRRRGAAQTRAATLDRLPTASPSEVLAEQVRRRGAVTRTELMALGVTVPSTPLVRVSGDWLVDPDVWAGWQQALAAAVAQRATSTPLDPRLPVDGVARRLGVPDRVLLVALAEAAGLRVGDGRVESAADPVSDLGPAEDGVRWLEHRLRDRPFAAPDRPELDAWGLGVRELAAAERAGRVLRLDTDLVLLPSGPALAMRTLAGLPQPFTTSAARQALDTTRRVVIPLLEHLDRRGWTRRLDPTHREVRRG
ncbi:MAG: SelB C-terminal domain-containing protein, partial [Propionibacteriaceae bacterium]